MTVVLRTTALTVALALATPALLSAGCLAPWPIVHLGGGMTVTVGRVRPCEVLDVKFFVLSHNLIRGAAGAALLNAELCQAVGVTQAVR